jgi:hypothetical protein
MPRIISIIAVASVAVLAIPAIACAKPAFRAAGVAAAPVKTDGKRWVAFDLLDAQHTRLLDTRSGIARDIERPALTECGGTRPSLVSVMGGTALWSCQVVAGSPGAAAIYDVESARLQVVRLAAGNSCGGDVWTPTAAGRTWITGTAVSYHYAASCFVNWRNGHVVVYGPRSRNNRVELDSPSLGVRLCKPIRRLPNPERVTSIEAADRWAPLHYQRPWAASVRGADQRADTFRTYEVVLQRCGRRARVIDRSRRGIGPLQLGGGIVSWGRGTTDVRVYDLSERRSRRVRLPRGSTLSGHTASSLFASRWLGPGRYAIFAAAV